MIEYCGCWFKMLENFTFHGMKTRHVLREANRAIYAKVNVGETIDNSTQKMHHASCMWHKP